MIRQEPMEEYHLDLLLEEVTSLLFIVFALLKMTQPISYGMVRFLLLVHGVLTWQPAQMELAGLRLTILYRQQQIPMDLEQMDE